MANTHDIPWKRISAEGVAIVVSILLAFSIEAWWAERQERAEERGLLESLYVEFEVNRDEAAFVISVHERAIQAVATLLELSQDEILALPMEAVEEMVGSLGNPYTFNSR